MYEEVGHCIGEGAYLEDRIHETISSGDVDEARIVQF